MWNNFTKCGIKCLKSKEKYKCCASFLVKGRQDVGTYPLYVFLLIILFFCYLSFTILYTFIYLFKVLPQRTWSPLIFVHFQITTGQSLSKCDVIACRRLLLPYLALKMGLLLSLAGT